MYLRCMLCRQVTEELCSFFTLCEISSTDDNGMKSFMHRQDKFMKNIQLYGKNGK